MACNHRRDTNGTPARKSVLQHIDLAEIFALARPRAQALSRQPAASAVADREVRRAAGVAKEKTPPLFIRAILVGLTKENETDWAPPRGGEVID